MAMRQFALRMYESMKRNGLGNETRRALQGEDGNNEEIKDGGRCDQEGDTGDGVPVEGPDTSAIYARHG